MGRSSSGKYTTSESNRLDLRVILRNGQIQKGKHITGTIEWTNGSSIRFESKYTKDEIYFRVVYSITSNRTGEVTDYDYKIDLVTIPSNLGKGEILYLVCPESYRRARVLFMAYGHHKYIHRDLYLDKYGLRLYYNSQIAEKSYYHSARYFKLEREIEDLESRLFVKHRKQHYKGKPTKGFIKLKKLIDQREYHNYKRNIDFIKMVKSKFGINFDD